MSEAKGILDNLVGWLVPVLEPYISIRIKSKESTIGRAEGCNINLSQVVGIPSQKALSSVSRLHAKIFYDEDGKVFVIDNQSSNSTFVNGQQLAPHDPIELPDNSYLKLGKLEFRFKKF